MLFKALLPFSLFPTYFGNVAVMAGASVVTMRLEVACILLFAESPISRLYLNTKAKCRVAIYHHTCAIYFLVKRRKLTFLSNLCFKKFFL